MLRLKEIKPMFNQVLVTEELYGYDDKDEAGIIVASKGDIKPYQTVVAVGDDVKKVKPGDVVAINFYKYAEFKENPNSVKAMGGNRMVNLHLNEVELVDENNEVVRCFIIDERDVKYILVDFDEVTYNKDDELIEVPKLNLILPNNKFRT